MKNKKVSIHGLGKLLAILILAAVAVRCDEPRKTYKVSFNANGGAPTPDTQKVQSGRTAIAPTADKTPKLNDKVFLHWYVDVNASDKKFDFSSPISKDITLYAKWGDTYPVSFVTNSSESLVPTQSIKPGEKATRPTPNPVKTGNKFVNWYADKALTTVFDFDQLIGQSTTVYAKWELNQYTVTFDSNGGVTTPSELVLKHGDWVPRPKTMAYIGDDAIQPKYALLAWYTELSGGSIYKFNMPVTGDLKLYARWLDVSLGTGYIFIQGSDEQGTIGGVFRAVPAKLVDFLVPQGYKDMNVIDIGTDLSSGNGLDVLATADALTTGDPRYVDGVLGATGLGDGQTLDKPNSTLTSVQVYGQLTTIGNRAFIACHELTSVIIASDLNFMIGYHAFRDCPKLTDVQLSEHILAVKGSAFRDCSSLATIELPGDVLTEIGAKTFMGCTELTTITLGASTPPTLGAEAFSGAAKLSKILVPATAVAAYKAAAGWSDFADKIQAK